MLRTDVIWPDHRHFKSKTEWEPVGFFSECLCNATTFDLMLGFFSSSAIQVLADGFALFLYNGGRMRLVINDILSEQDLSFIDKGESKSVLEFFDLENLRQIKETLSVRDEHFFNCLSWLIQNDRLEIKIIRPQDGTGISHTKMGVFGDGINSISFDGSCNFSRTALLSNIESITASCDWDGDIAKAKVSHAKETFNITFEGRDESVEYVDAVSVKSNLSNVFRPQSVEDLLEEENAIIEKSIREKSLPNTIYYALNRAKNRLDLTLDRLSEPSVSYGSENERNKPRFPYSSGPREYQKEAFEKWKKNGQKGLFAMATGTGKTITSLNCLLEIYKRLGYYKAIILVPTITLVNQWENECKKFCFNNIIKVTSKNKDWHARLDRIHLMLNCNKDSQIQDNYIIISTYASFSKDNIFKNLNCFERTKTLLIADEAHNLGAPGILKKIKEILYLRRIGLSATPERQYEELTNRTLSKFFGAEEKYTYEYSMEEAIQNGVLCRYYYYPHIVKLSKDEMDQYVKISIKIAKYFNYESCQFDSKDSLLMSMLLARQRIIHKAKNKLPVFKEIIEKRFKEKGNLKYTLVYVPEGNRPDQIDNLDVFDSVEELDEDPESNHLIDIYTKEILKIDKFITVKKFVSGIADREQVLSSFANGKLQVLTSMKCLDEGVDIPRSEMAIFCSSTGNPRQFIQRRGRILRKHPDKHLAVLHDLIVIPEVSSICDSYRMEQILLKKELLRVKNFAMLSENPSYSEIELRGVMMHYGLNLYNNNHIL